MPGTLVYCNGDSYSNENVDASLQGRTYANEVGYQLNGSVINKSISGSCNRRIVRTTVSDLLAQRKIEPQQKIIALLGLTFDLRSEIWVENPKKTFPPEEANFRRHHFSKQTSWRENLLRGLDIGTENSEELEPSFFRKFSEGKAYFYNPYAERLNLLCDIVMLKKFLESLNVNFLIFQCPKGQPVGNGFLLDQFKQEIANDERIFDFESFGFLDWAHGQGFVPLDFKDRPQIGHYGADAHQAFATKVLLPRLKETGQI
jgi:hypothetical protein